MGTFVVRAGLALLLLALLAACATLSSDKKAKSTLPPPIIEEDLPGAKSESQGATSQEQTFPSVTQPPAAPFPDSTPPAIDPGHRAPRRIPWKDTKGRDRDVKRGEDAQTYEER